MMPPVSFKPCDKAKMCFLSAVLVIPLAMTHDIIWRWRSHGQLIGGEIQSVDMYVLVELSDGRRGNPTPCSSNDC
jgi:hypothetical protein